MPKSDSRPQKLSIKQFSKNFLSKFKTLSTGIPLRRLPAEIGHRRLLICFKWGLNTIRFISNIKDKIFLEIACLVFKICMLEKFVIVIPTVPSHLVIHFVYDQFAQDGMGL